MTKRRAWIGCGLVVTVLLLFVATFVIAPIETFLTGKLIAGHFPLWTLLGSLTFVALSAAIGSFVGPHAIRGQTVLGQITEVRPGIDPSEEKAEAVVRYEIEGRTHEFITKQLFGAKPGDRVEVLYLPADPSDAYVATSIWIFTWFALGCVSLGSMWLAMWLCVRMGK
jgi:hypothetical protein